MRNLAPTFAIIPLLLATGCASIVSKTSREVSLRSDPTGARVTVVDEKGTQLFDGRTPSVVKLRTGKPYFGKKEYAITFNLEGYREHRATVRSTLNGWYIGNLGFGGLIGFLIVDPLTGAMWRFEEEEVVAQLAALQVGATNPPTLHIVEWRDVPEDLRPRLVRIH